MAEVWRYDVENLISARRDALSAAEQYATESAVIATKESDDVLLSSLDGQPVHSSRRSAAFDRVPSELTHDFAEWTVRVRGRWSRPEDIFRTEGRAVVIAFRHALRTSSH